MNRFGRTGGAVLAVLAAVIASACSAHAVAPRPVAVSPPAVTGELLPVAPTAAAPTAAPRFAGEPVTGPPSGTGPQIALRFLRALQAGDDILASQQLSLVARRYFAAAPSGRLHAVLRDVAHNADLQTAGPCKTAQRLTAASAVVRCGDVNVVVHVLDDPLLAGVQLSAWHGLHDVFRGPHTHAVTTVAP